MVNYPFRELVGVSWAFPLADGHYRSILPRFPLSLSAMTASTCLVSADISLRYAGLRTLDDDKTSNLWITYRKELLSMEISRYTSLALVNWDAAMSPPTQVIWSGRIRARYTSAPVTTLARFACGKRKRPTTRKLLPIHAKTGPEWGSKTLAH